MEQILSGSRDSCQYIPQCIFYIQLHCYTWKYSTKVFKDGQNFVRGFSSSANFQKIVHDNFHNGLQWAYTIWELSELQLHPVNRLYCFVVCFDGMIQSMNNLTWGNEKSSIWQSSLWGFFLYEQVPVQTLSHETTNAILRHQNQSNPKNYHDTL